MLASCLDQIEDERDLAAGAKCLIQARHEASKSDRGRQKSGRGHKASELGKSRQKPRKNSESKDSSTLAFVIANDSAEDAVLENHDVSNLLVGTQVSDETLRQIAGTPDLWNASRQTKVSSNNQRSILHQHLNNSWAVPDASKSSIFPNVHERQNRGMYQQLRHFEKARVVEHLRIEPTNQSDREVGTTQILRTVRIKFDETLRLFRQPHKYSGSFKETGKIPNNFNGTKKHSKLIKLNSRIGSLKNARFFRKTDKMQAWNLTGAGVFWKDRRWRQRRRRKRSPYRLLTNHVMKSDSIIVDVSYSRFNPVTYFVALSVENLSIS